MRLTESVFTDGVDFPEAGFHGLILDFDDTITSPLRPPDKIITTT